MHLLLLCYVLNCLNDEKLEWEYLWLHTEAVHFSRNTNYYIKFYIKKQI